jgi:Tfp pilus assembly protein PilF
LSPAELAKLEHAFATDPASEAYRPLAEAYLGMGRFMEAMVVCKKGVKAHPTAADPRVLLARVYADQGKEKKALEEALGALQVAPNDKSALRLTGVLQLKTGEADAGKATLLRAFSIDPNGKVDRVTMKPVSPTADFSWDYQDLLFTPAAGQ